MLYWRCSLVPHALMQVLYNWRMLLECLCSVDLLCSLLRSARAFLATRSHACTTSTCPLTRLAFGYVSRHCTSTACSSSSHVYMYGTCKVARMYPVDRVVYDRSTTTFKTEPGQGRIGRNIQYDYEYYSCCLSSATHRLSSMTSFQTSKRNFNDHEHIHGHFLISKLI